MKKYKFLTLKINDGDTEYYAIPEDQAVDLANKAENVDNNCESWEILNDKELIDDMNRAINNMKFLNERRGTKTYETDKYYIVESGFASAWEAYTVFEK